MNTFSLTRPPCGHSVLRLSAAIGLAIGSVLLPSQVTTAPPKEPSTLRQPAEARPLVQIALLLDTSNSMDGLIEQAKSQLWRMVNEFNHAKRRGRAPVLQVALYEYGNNGLDARQGFVRQVLGFTTDLERVSTELFRLRTNGGEEYCGWVIRDSLRQLDWSSRTGDYKTIFIAGNEPFSQGPVSYVNACRDAIQKGVIVNTIHCGSVTDGRLGHWSDGAALAEGKFLTINQDAVVKHIDAPQDAEIGRLSAALNETYVGYGAREWVESNFSQQRGNDANASRYRSQGSVVQRALTKANANYSNENWDLVDATRTGHVKLEALPKDQLPATLQSLSLTEIRHHLAEKQAERGRLQGEINRLNREREQWLQVNQSAPSKSDSTLDSAVTAAVREQAGKCEFKFE